MKFTRDDILDRLDDVIYADKRKLNRIVYFFRAFVLFACIFVFVCGLSAGLGVFMGIIKNAPDLDTLSFSPSGFASKTYDAKGNLVATLVQEGSNREEAVYEEIPEDLINAFVAIEDQRFWEHNGIDLKSISRAIVGVVKDDDSAGGGSTITQQLIKNNVFDGGMEKGLALYERKFQEWYIALMLENRPNVDKMAIKKTIITDYLNTINLGNNTLGVKVAAHRYFNKELKDLDLSECTVLASITKNPSRLNPITHPDQNQERRLQVLKNMREQGYITEEQYNEAKSSEIYDRIENNNIIETANQAPYSYFTDELIDQCLETFKTELGMTNAEAKDLLYSGGLTIMTTQDPDIQSIVDKEVNDPDNYDTAKYSIKWRCSVKDTDGKLTHYSENDIASFTRNDLGNTSFDGLFKSEDAVNERIEAFKTARLKEGDEIIAETLDTELEPQLSFVLMDQFTKEVKAISGGRGEKKYSLTLNRATGTTRQPGSTFKVVTAFAPAIEINGATLATTYYDSEYTLGSKTFKNWWSSGTFFGYSGIREGIEFSMNIVAVRCMVDTVTPDEGVEFARKLGISTLTDSDRNAATALGGITKGVTNLELTNAFASIADGGVYGKPKFFTKIYNHDGTLLIDNTEQEQTRVMKETTAYLLTDAMRRSVISHSKWAGGASVNNTSSRAYLDNMTAAGKSGTTSSNNDVWFIGFTPYYTAGVWAGCDDNQSLYDSSTGEYNGGTSFHKDIWKKIMTQVHSGLDNKSFDMPDDIVQMDVCRKSGKLPNAGCYLDVRAGSSAVYTEFFDAANVPTEVCDHHTLGGNIIVPSGEEYKYTDDTAHNGALAAAAKEEEEKEEGGEGTVTDSPSGPGSSDSTATAGTYDSPSIVYIQKFTEEKIGPGGTGSNGQ